MENVSFDKADIQKMVAHPDQDVRAILAQKVCRSIARVELSASEQAIVEKILSLIVRDAATMVRRALAVTLRNSPNLPKDIARRLIRDVDSIAVPVLEQSPVLDDEDLLEVLRSKAAAKMMAITRRARVSGDLVKAVIRYGDRRAVASLAANDGAEIGAELGAKMIDIYKNDDLIAESFISRRELPALVVEKLISVISTELVYKLHEKHEIPLDISIDLATRTRERASIDFIAQSWVSRDIPRLVERLEREARLTSALIVRAACCGQMPFVEAALAIKAGVSKRKAALMVHDSGPFGLRALCTQCGMDERDFRVLHASVVIFRDMEQKGQILKKDKFQTLMLERILSLPITFRDEDVTYLLEKLDKVAA